MFIRNTEKAKSKFLSFKRYKNFIINVLFQFLNYFIYQNFVIFLLFKSKKKFKDLLNFYLLIIEFIKICRQMKKFKVG